MEPTKDTLCYLKSRYTINFLGDLGRLLISELPGVFYISACLFPVVKVFIVSESNAFSIFWPCSIMGSQPPNQGSNPHPPALEGRVLTTELPGRSQKRSVDLTSKNLCSMLFTLKEWITTRPCFQRLYNLLIRHLKNKIEWDKWKTTWRAHQGVNRL